MGTGSLNSTDSTTLYNLTQLCPADQGACIHQARALYRIIYPVPIRFPESCNENNARLIKYSSAAEQSIATWNVRLFPNPTDHRVSIQSTVSEEILHMEMCDLSGRTVLSRDVAVNDFIANLDLTLINGMYLVTISNSKHESLVKKLLIDQ